MTQQHKFFEQKASECNW